MAALPRGSHLKVSSDLPPEFPKPHWQMDTHMYRSLVQKLRCGCLAPVSALSAAR
jgi:hypothetical protein